MHVVIGTAGHIDHGKSALVKALTGFDPDRLREEKERGMTTDLGFAFLDDDVTIIDVPGHEKFVRHMLAGASAVDLVALVVAADDGVMPQTREHFDICRLMGIELGLVIITKVDLVDDDWMELVRADVADLVAGTFLDQAPVLAASSVTGAGIPEVRAAIDKLVRQVRARSDRGVFRLPIDRSFAIKGFGTIVAGTVLSGRARVGDRLELLPQRREVRVRGIQRHNQSLKETVLGDRAAINLHGLGRETPARGNVLATPGYYSPTAIVNATLTLLVSAARPLRNMTRVRVHIGTSEVMARVVLLDVKELRPGQQGMVQYRLEEQIVCDWGDHYVIRSYSPQHTIGGGVVLEANADKERRFVESTIVRLRAQSSGDTGAVIEQMLFRYGLQACQPERLAREVAIADCDLDEHLAGLIAAGKVRRFRFEGHDWVVHEDGFTRARTAVLEALAQFHRRCPFRVGLRRPELRSKSTPGIAVALFDTVVSELLEAGEVDDAGGRLMRAGHEVRLKPEEQEFFDRVAKAVGGAGFAPPALDELLAGAKKGVAERVRTALLETGILVDVGGGIAFHRDVVAEGREIVLGLFAERPELAAADVRRGLDTTRRYTIPLLNYFDSVGLTQRRGDKRVLRNPAGNTEAER